MITEESREEMRKCIFSQQNNAPSHASTVAEAAIGSFELIEHPPYSPDLAPGDTDCFQNLANTCAKKDFLQTIT